MYAGEYHLQNFALHQPKWLRIFEINYVTCDEKKSHNSVDNHSIGRLFLLKKDNI